MPKIISYSVSPKLKTDAGFAARYHVYVYDDDTVLIRKRAFTFMDKATTLTIIRTIGKNCLCEEMMAFKKSSLLRIAMTVFNPGNEQELTFTYEH